MRTIIAGSRTFADLSQMEAGLRDHIQDITTVISGTAQGADQLGEQWADMHNIPVERYPAFWTTYGRSAGYIRNEQMANTADALIAFWDGKSRGTMHMIKLAKSYGLKVTVIEFIDVPLHLR